MDTFTNRKNKVIEIIQATLTLASGNLDDAHRQIILGRAGYLLDGLWKVQWKSTKCECLEHRANLTSLFWKEICDELFYAQKVAKMKAIFDETVNPPGKEGNVAIFIYPTNSVEYWTINLAGAGFL